MSESRAALTADPLGSPIARAAFEATTEGLLVLDPDGVVIAMNGAFGRLYGIEVTDAVGRSYTDFARHLEVRRLDQAVDEARWVTLRALRGERIEGVVQSIRNRRSGREFLARCGAAPLFEAGRLAAVTITVEDVTEATRARQMVEGALSAAEVGTYRIDLISETVWGDGNFARLHGLFTADVTGGPVRRVYATIHPGDLRRVESIVRASTRTGEPHEIEYRVVLPGGGERWILSRGRAELDERGVAVQRLGSIVDVTERKQAEETARRAAERYRALAEAAASMVFVADAQGHLVDIPVSRGIDRPQAGAGWLDVVHPDDRDGVREVWSHALATGEPFATEFRLRIAEGGYRWHAARGVRVADEHGATKEWVGVITDAHARVEANEALREAAERSRLLVESVPEIAWTARPDGVLDYFNERWYEYTGQTRDLGADETWPAAVHAEDREPLAAAWRRSVETGEPYAVEMRLRGTEGEYRWFLARARPLRDRAGEIVRWFGVTSDIHDPRTREASLALLSDLAEATRSLSDPQEIIGVGQRMLGERLGTSRCAYAEVEADEDTFTILQDWSPGLPSTVGRYSLRLFGRRAETGLRAGHTFVVDDVDRDLALGDGRETFNSILIKGIVCCALVKEGRLAALMAVHQDRPRAWRPEEVSLVEAVADRCWAEIERARAERALREANSLLEQRVADRTQELTRANRDLDEFSYSVAHDLRAPLRAIVSTSRILLDDLADRLQPDERDALERQARAGTKLARIVDDLLGFAKLANAEPRREPFDLSALARRIATEIAARRGGPGEFVVQDGMRAVGDPNLVGYALTNLLDNARKFSPQGGTVTVGEADGVFFVRDEGMGFDMAHAGKLFVAFERLVNGEIEGTGVGLANVKRIVEKHGGRVWAESEPGKGATFWFTLGS